MVVKMMKWRPWPPLVTKKYEVKLVVRRLEGWHLVHEGAPEKERCERLTVEIRWRGPKVALGSLRRTVKRNFTKEAQGVGQNGIVSWEDEEFQSRCSLNAYKENVFHPWEIGFSVFNNGLKGGPKNKLPVVGTSLLNLAECASVSDEKDSELSVPLSLSSGAAGLRPLLWISLGLLELGTARETLGPVQRMLMPVSSPSQQPVETVSTDQKEEVSAIKASLRKVKMLREYVSTRRSKKACREEEGSEGGCSTRSDDSENNYHFDSDSSDDGEEGESDVGKEDASARNSFSYESLAYTQQFNM